MKTDGIKNIEDLNELDKLEKKEIIDPKNKEISTLGKNIIRLFGVLFLAYVVQQVLNYAFGITLITNPMTIGLALVVLIVLKLKSSKIVSDLEEEGIKSSKIEKKIKITESTSESKDVKVEKLEDDNDKFKTFIATKNDDN